MEIEMAPIREEDESDTGIQRRHHRPIYKGGYNNNNQPMGAYNWEQSARNPTNRQYSDKRQSSRSSQRNSARSSYRDPRHESANSDSKHTSSSIRNNTPERMNETHSQSRKSRSSSKRSKRPGKYKQVGYDVVNGKYYQRTLSGRQSAEYLAAQENDDMEYCEMEQEPEKRPSGCHPRSANGLAYFGAVGLFLFGFNIPFEATIPRPAIGNLLSDSMQNFYQEIVVIPLTMWGVHFARRFAEVLFVHEYCRRMSMLESIGASIYYWGFGLWIGLSQNFHLGYLAPHPGLFYLGLVIFIIGEIGNCVTHFALKKLRQKPEGSRESVMTSSKRVLPTGKLFHFVSCPHYTFELLTWLGYALMSMTLSSFVFFAATAVTLVVYSYKHHKAYTDYFDGEDGKPLYPPNRKRLIPFIY